MVRFNKEKSSPSHINATIGTSVRLRWDYTYVGDGMYGPLRYKFKEQIIEFHSPSQTMIQVIARRIGQNGALKLQSPTPTTFRGRAAVISSISTLVIHNVQYNDSTYNFSSYVTLDVNPGYKPEQHKSNKFSYVKITVYGMKMC